jgi:heme A synthase
MTPTPTSFDPLAPAPRTKLSTPEVIAVAVPIVGGLLGATAIILSLGGREKLGQVMLGAWAVLTAAGGAAMALTEIEENRRERERWAQLGYRS